MNETKKPLVSVVILDWNGGAASCAEAVKSVVEQDYHPKEIIFVDNGSTVSSVDAVRSVFPDLKVVSLSENLGCPEGRNRGAAIARGELLFFLENDGVWGERTVVREIVDIFARDRRVGAVYSAVEGYASGIRDRMLDVGDKEPKSLRLASSFRGGASAIRRELFLNLGGFPGHFFRQGEERFLATKIYQADYKVFYFPNAVMRHKGSDYPGKSRAVLRFTLQNDLETILRLNPILSVVKMLIPKLAVNFYRFAKRRAFVEFFSAVFVAVKNLVVREKCPRISNDTFSLLEAIRFHNDYFETHSSCSVDELKEAVRRQGNLSRFYS